MPSHHSLGINEHSIIAAMDMADMLADNPPEDAEGKQISGDELCGFKLGLGSLCLCLIGGFLDDHGYDLDVELEKRYGSEPEDRGPYDIGEFIDFAMEFARSKGFLCEHENN